MTIQGVKTTPYLNGDFAYPLHIYLQKTRKSYNSNDVDKKRYVSSMNSTEVIIENAFGSLEIRWCILKNFNFNVNKAQ